MKGVSFVMTGVLALFVAVTIYEFSKKRPVAITAQQGAGVLLEMEKLIHRLHSNPEKMGMANGDIAVISKGIPTEWWDALDGYQRFRTVTDEELAAATFDERKAALFELRLVAPTPEGHPIIRIYSATYWKNKSGELLVNYEEGVADFSVVKTQGVYRPVYLQPNNACHVSPFSAVQEAESY